MPKPLDVERVVGGRTVRAGDVVRIVGLSRARVIVGDSLQRGFRVLGFRGDEVEVFGAKRDGLAPAVRTFRVDRITGS